MPIKAKTADLTTGALLPKIILFSLPLAASGILQLLFNAADVVVVGRFAGSQALAAVGSTTSLVNLLVNLFVGMSVGANVVTARALGAHDETAVRNTVHTSVVLSLLGGLLLAFVGVTFSRPLLELMGSPDDVIDLAALYLRIFFVGMPVNMLYNFGAALMRSVGDTKRPLYCLAFSGCINVVLNLIFVIIFHLSVAGVALATIISQAISAVLVVRLLMKEEGPLKLDLKALRLHPAALAQIMRVGIPAGLQGTVFSLSNVVIQSSINTFGSIVIAGNSSASSIEGFVYVGMNAFQQASVTFTSQNFGARKYENVRKVVLYCSACVICVGAILGVGATAAGSFLCGIFSSDPAVVAAGVHRLSIICQLYCICGLMDVLSGAIRGIGYSVLPMVGSLLGSCALRLVWVATIFRMVGTIDSLYISYPISWTLTAAVHLLCFVFAMRKIQRSVPQKHIPL